MAKEVDTKGYIKLYRKAQDTKVFKRPSMRGNYLRTASLTPNLVVVRGDRNF